MRSRARDIVEEVRVGKLSLIDLAGSERAAATENRGIRMVEVRVVVLLLVSVTRGLLLLGFRLTAPTHCGFIDWFFSFPCICG